jgi:hypothetical protein
MPFYWTIAFQESSAREKGLPAILRSSSPALNEANLRPSQDSKNFQGSSANVERYGIREENNQC